jgi:hypothetical protein
MSSNLYEDIRAANEMYEKNLNVILLNYAKHTLKCKTCHGVWTPKRDENGNLPERSWVCPNGCNKNIK